MRLILSSVVIGIIGIVALAGALFLLWFASILILAPFGVYLG